MQDIKIRNVESEESAKEAVEAAVKFMKSDTDTKTYTTGAYAYRVKQAKTQVTVTVSEYGGSI